MSTVRVKHNWSKAEKDTGVLPAISPFIPSTQRFSENCKKTGTDVYTLYLVSAYYSLDIA
jgi:hypothetical protein